MFITYIGRRLKVYHAYGCHLSTLGTGSSASVKDFEQIPCAVWVRGVVLWIDFDPWAST